MTLRRRRGTTPIVATVLAAAAAGVVAGAVALTDDASRGDPTRVVATEPAVGSSELTPPSPTATPTPDPVAEAAARQRRLDDAVAARVEEVLATLDRDARVGQLLTLTVYGSSIDESHPGNTATHDVDTIRGALERWQPGGVVFFNTSDHGDTGNLQDPAQIRALADEIHEVSAGLGATALTMTDQEYGLVERIGPPATQLPGAMAIAAAGPLAAAEVAEVAARELAAMGIDMALAPVADVNTNPDNPVIGIRSFGADPAAVGDLIDVEVRTLLAGGVAPVVKHFPGHGDTDVDSHRDLPVLAHDPDRLAAIELVPFRAAVAAGAPAVMTGHLAVPAIDPSGEPASLSPVLIGDVLRGDLGFEGVVMTDALTMEGVQSRAPGASATVSAFLAGNDILLMPGDTSPAVSALLAALDDGRITADRLDASVRRILTLKARLGLLGDLGLPADEQPVPPRPDLSVVGTGMDVAAEVAGAGLTRLAGACPALAPGSSVAVVGPAAFGATQAAADALAAAGHTPTVVTYDDLPTGTTTSAALTAAGPAALTILLVDAGDQAARDLAARVDADNTTLVILTRLPYRAGEVAGDTVVAAYDDGPATAIAAADLATGTGMAPGSLPVPVEDIGDVGFTNPC